MSEIILDIKNVNTFYGPIQALRDVSLHINTGEIISLIGANGAGKSTLLMTIFGAPKAKSGQILYKGQDLTRLQAHQIAGKGIAQVPEGRRIFAKMTVEENIMIGALPIGDKHMDEDRATMFELFPRLKERRNQRAGTLSGGEQQMLAIARALMGRPDMILLDEPSLGLAPLIVRQIFSVLKELGKNGKTIFLVEQNANHALKLADRAYVMVNGEIRMTGTGAELLANPEIRDAYLGSH
ncbi:MAG: ABC transporter ATP-binding protein [Advenella sp.]|jgi:branched-chain amino acid transport system ATP-binding protein|uniref:ABC transporter ATP-binding protein n=1 Tax=Advenella alkanexedens TaxID=1481665 RepID=UPI00145CEB1E|nr:MULTISPECIES: ABC transporter ATP-binding protein [Advenella]MDD3757907.1 ABC transporter ATP-binding protein [Advenella sp.]NLN67990.1 ABC transporter ATP-binding protein [Alcaligenaceae bacterium]WKU19816.1 ABC transporter ATP-binding protein [Advenella alkanexedens]